MLQPHLHLPDLRPVHSDQLVEQRAVHQNRNSNYKKSFNKPCGNERAQYAYEDAHLLNVQCDGLPRRNQKLQLQQYKTGLERLHGEEEAAQQYYRRVQRAEQENDRHEHQNQSSVVGAPEVHDGSEPLASLRLGQADHVRGEHKEARDHDVVQRVPEDGEPAVG